MSAFILILLCFCVYNTFLHLSVSSSSLPLCDGKETKYTNGSWVEDDREIAFHCCTAGKSHINDAQSCGTESHGSKPMYGAFYHGSIEHYAPFHNVACGCYDYENLDESIASNTNDPKYSWHPHDCDLPAFDGKDFCNLLGNRTLLMIGDSTMQQTASSLMSLIHETQGGCEAQIHMGTSYMFGFTHAGVNIWSRFYDEIIPDICIINFGAWFKDPGDIYSIWEMVKEGIKDRQMKHNTTFVWKTLNAPHPDCTNRNTPDETDVGVQAPLFGWEYWPEFDKMSIELATNLNMKIIDMAPTYLRPDYHIGKLLGAKYHEYITKEELPRSKMDCLHYCVPGPLNVFGEILYTMLKTNYL